LKQEYRFGLQDRWNKYTTSYLNGCQNFCGDGTAMELQLNGWVPDLLFGNSFKFGPLRVLALQFYTNDLAGSVGVDEKSEKF
jgi:hypothetical protein